MTSTKVSENVIFIDSIFSVFSQDNTEFISMFDPMTRFLLQTDTSYTDQISAKMVHEKIYRKCYMPLLNWCYMTIRKTQLNCVLFEQLQ